MSDLLRTCQEIRDKQYKVNRKELFGTRGSFPTPQRLRAKRMATVTAIFPVNTKVASFY